MTEHPFASSTAATTANGGPATFSRRQVLAGLGAAGIVTVVGGSPAASLMALADPTAVDNPVIVNVFLRGGADGLDIAVPYGDPDYYRLRSSIARQRSDLDDLDGFFGLNQAFAPLLPLYRSGDLAIVHAAGSPDPVRSHFAAMDNMDLAFGTTGWMQRVLLAEGSLRPLDAVSVDSRTSPALRGPASGMAFPRIDRFIETGDELSPSRPAIEAMYRTADPLIGGATLGGFSAIDELRGIRVTPDVPYPNNNVARPLREAAQLIKADVGVKMITVNAGGWDHHTNQVAEMARRGERLSSALAAFMADLGEAKSRVVTVVMTEFGRTAEQNGGGGTDHGHGSVMMVLGGGLANGGGGKVHLADDQWVGLSAENLNRGRYLAISTDFRSVLAEVLDRHYGFTNLETVFPGFQPNYPGLLNRDAPPPPPPPPRPQPQLGSVSGTVRFLGGTPAEGVVVDLFTDSGGGERGTWLGDTRTAADGTYGFDVEPGDYVLTKVAPAEGRFAGGTRWLNSAMTVAAGQTVTGIDAELLSGGQEGATIGGMVVDGSGPVAGVAVDLFQAGADGSRGAWLGQIATAADGSYQFDVQAACYVLTFIAPSGQTFVGGGAWYQPSLCVAAGEVVTTVDATLA